MADGESFGAYMRRKRPDIYGSSSEEALNATVAERLATDEGRARLLAKLRQNIEFKPTTTDEDILRIASRNLGSAQPTNKGTQAEQVNKANLQRRSAESYAEATRGAAKITAAAGAGMPVSAGTKDVLDDAKNLVPHDSPLELPVVQRMGPGPDGPGLTEMLAQTPGGRIEGEIQKVLVDKNNRGVAALLPGAGVGPEGQSGFWGVVDPVNRVTGNRSYFQTAGAQVMRRGANALRSVFGDGGDVSPGEGTGIGNTGYGYREAAGDIGGVAGKATPNVSAALGRGAAGATAGAMHALSAVDSAEAWALEKAAKAAASTQTAFSRAMSMGGAAAQDRVTRKEPAVPAADRDTLLAGTLREWAGENRDEAARYKQLAKDSMDVATWDIPDHAKPFVGEAFGEAVGKTVGEVDSMVAPSDVAVPGAVAKGIGKAARAVAPVATAKAVARTYQATAPARAALQHVKERGVEWAEGKGLGFVANRPFAMAHSGMARDQLDRGAGMAKNSATMAGEAMTRDMMDAEAALVARKGWSPEEFERFATGARDRWTTKAAREGASPEEADIIRLWQPFHEQVWRQTSSNVPYNPFHDYYGADPSRAAKVLNTLDARQAQQVEQVDPWKATLHDPAANTHVPGLDVMSPEALKTSKAYDVRDRAWKADAIAGRIEDQLVDTALPGMKSRLAKKLLTRGARREAENARQAVLSAMPNTSFGQSMTRSLEHVAKVQEDAAAAMSLGYKDLAKADPRFTDIKTLIASPAHQKNAAAFAGTRAYERDGLGNVRLTKKGSAQPIEHLALNKTLRDDGQLVLQVEGQTPMSGLVMEAGKGMGSGPAATGMMLPATFGAEWHGRTVPRTWARGLMESVNLSHAPNSRVAAQRARDLDRLLGLNQVKRLITIGNMGFDFRNRQSEVLRVLTEEGSNAVDRKLLAAIAEVSNAPLGRASGKTVKIGGQTFDTGVLHTELRRMGVMRSGITEDAVRKFATEPGSGAVAHAIGVSPNVSLGAGIDAVNKVVMKPGEASSAAADKFAREMFNYEFPGGRGLSNHYRGEDGIRMWSALAKMKRGMTVEAAARDTKTLLIDYTDKSAFEQYAGTVIPFVKYYTGAARGALRTAINNPRRYTRAADFARIAENYDRSIEGYGSFDPRDKNLMEKLSMSPVVKMGKGRSSLRFEGPGAEMASLADSVAGGDVNFARNLTPVIGGAYASLTGRDIGTGRNVFGLSEKEHKDADMGMIDQWSFARETDDWLKEGSRLGAHPYGQLLWSIMKHAPIVGGRMMSPQMETVGRTAMGLGSGPSSRTVHGSVDALRRSSLSSAGVVRAPPSDPLQERAKRAKKVADRMPQLILESQADRMRRGKPTSGVR